MKKTILSFLCIGSACLVMAQTKPSSDPNVNRNNQQSIQSNTNSNLNNTPANSTLNNGNIPPATNNEELDMNTNTRTLRTTTSSPAYSVTVPTSVQTTFQAAYPGISTATWTQSGDWYRARYMENGRLMEASYREDGKAMTREASPIMKTYVPEEAVSKALEMYGANVYAIAMSKGSDGAERFSVTIIENGESRTEWMNADGSSVMSPYRTEMDQQSTDANMNNTQQTTEPVPADNSDQSDRDLNQAQPVNYDDMIDETGELETIEQNNEAQQVDPNNSLNNDANNDATTSDEMMQQLNDQRDVDNSPEDRTPEEITGTDPVYEY